MDAGVGWILTPRHVYTFCMLPFKSKFLFCILVFIGEITYEQFLCGDFIFLNLSKIKPYMCWYWPHIFAKMWPCIQRLIDTIVLHYLLDAHVWLQYALIKTKRDSFFTLALFTSFKLYPPIIVLNNRQMIVS